MSKTLQVLGLFALAAWTLGGLLAWSRATEQIHVTVRAGDGGAEPEASALLADRLDVLGADVEALAAALNENMTLLADAIASEGDAKAAAAARVDERLAALERALPSALAARESAGALDAVLRRLEALDSATTATAASVASVEPVALDPEPVPPERPSGLRTSPPDGSAPEEPVSGGLGSPADPPAKRSFLAFSLPSRDFRFEGRQTFEVLGSLSRVGFDAKSSLHDFTGIADAVSGTFEVDLAQPGSGITGRVEIRASDLRTGLGDRDEAMREHLDAETHETVSFEARRFAPSSVDREARRLEGTLHGAMTIRGETREVALAVRAFVDESRRLVVEGETALSLTDYGVPVPNKLGVISMDDEVRVWIRLRARASASRSGGSH